MFSVNRQEFGPGFVFGAATSAYQIEGGHTDGRGPSIWDTFAATPGNVQGLDDGAVACDHYNRWPEDLDLIRDGGFDAYRFSFAWPRLIPEGIGAVNQAGIDFYDRLIDGMLERGLKPFGTLYHWDLPSALMDRGGWMNRDIAGWFADYATLVGAEVRRPAGMRRRRSTSRGASPSSRTISAFTRRAIATSAPRRGRCTTCSSRTAPASRRCGPRASRTSASSPTCRRSSRRPMRRTMSRRRGSPTGPTTAGISTGSTRAAIRTTWWRRSSPTCPRTSRRDMPTVSAPLDWVGINYYTRSLHVHGGDDPRWAKSIAGPLEKNDLGWEIYPKGLTDLLVRVSREYTKLPIYVTENGMSETTTSGASPTTTGTSRRCAMRRNRAPTCAATSRGRCSTTTSGPQGYKSRFGIVHVDYETQKRTPKGSYRAFQGMLHNTR